MLLLHMFSSPKKNFLVISGGFLLRMNGKPSLCQKVLLGRVAAPLSELATVPSVDAVASVLVSPRLYFRTNDHISVLGSKLIFWAKY